MAVNESRSMNAELLEGITDGVVKKLAPNRGGSMTDIASANTAAAILHQELYDGVEYGTSVKQAAGQRITTLRG